MKEEKYGALLERGTVTEIENGRYRVASGSRSGITSPPLAGMQDAEYQIGDKVLFFLFDDGDGLILTKL